MLAKPYIAESVEQATTYIRVTVPRSKIRYVMGPGLAELRTTIAAQAIAPAGP